MKCLAEGVLPLLGKRPRGVFLAPRLMATFVVIALGWLSIGWSLRAAELTATQSDRGVTIKIGDKLFAEYLVQSGSKPIVWPILGPTGEPMTRAYPMVKHTDEKDDHPHHRSLWFAHGNVNGVNFWTEGKNHGTIKHRSFEKVAGGREATVVTRNDWVGPDGKKVLADRRTLGFGVEGDSRWIDFDIQLTASEGPVTLGDTKEGTFAVRVAHPLAVDSQRGGRIVNSEGQVNADAWAKRSAWVDYHGPLGGQTVGIAILNHPGSFRYPTYWHVRTYGLFAANPFGVHDFTRQGSGTYTIRSGESIRLRYRIVLHKGDEKAAGIAAMWEKYIH